MSNPPAAVAGAGRPPYQQPQQQHYAGAGQQQYRPQQPQQPAYAAQGGNPYAQPPPPQSAETDFLRQNVSTQLGLQIGSQMIHAGQDYVNKNVHGRQRGPFLAYPLMLACPVHL